MAGVGVDEAMPNDLKNTAEQIAVEAAHLVRTAWVRMRSGGEVAVDTKSAETDVVTAVDRESEELVRARLERIRPGEPVLGEEGGGALGGGVTWVVDPIDGTVNFLYGLPAFAVSIAAQIDGVSVAGAVVEPVSGRRWTAVRGGGAWLDGDRLSVSAADRLDLALVGMGFSYARDRRVRQGRLTADLVGQVRDIRRRGAASLDLCAVAAGWLDGYFEHGLHRWDWAAGALIAREAGATVLLPGEAADLGEDATFAASPGIAAELRAALAEGGAAEV
ncbi:inositol monophosphatase [Amycolatopsis rubida]|uniref:Inositol-1-monophosphatase n=1 Tax=Amycolatopsis rubida TaxID=112413 RepID=A0ABX0BZP8_9PSEU|nr:MULTISPECIES: inositol monophosphatase family protein [Amycolatopsis]MYW94884.1 inositol monophosphatase [Amycolatopsis rubida]MYW95896.1 inositol monophosphatase [Amycolatopsis rubida]NEC59871.1 inositol monophosphatase [Amycolatopsis rubida]NEC60886.1 inositol monophosphatase [Amycolatopsis rubida]OAP26644.1 Inositol-1-monophosphatase SuhB [Amycolatopsis sp. M39]